MWPPQHYHILENLLFFFKIDTYKQSAPSFVPPLRASCHPCLPIFHKVFSKSSMQFTTKSVHTLSSISCDIPEAFDNVLEIPIPLPVFWFSCPGDTPPNVSYCLLTIDVPPKWENGGENGDQGNVGISDSASTEYNHHFLPTPAGFLFS